MQWLGPTIEVVRPFKLNRAGGAIARSLALALALWLVLSPVLSFSTAAPGGHRIPEHSDVSVDDSPDAGHGMSVSSSVSSTRAAHGECESAGHARAHWVHANCLAFPAVWDNGARLLTGMARARTEIRSTAAGKPLTRSVVPDPYPPRSA